MGYPLACSSRLRLGGQLVLLVVLLACLGCSVDLGVAEESSLRCRNSTECPEGFECRTGLGRCAPLGRNDLPSVSIAGLTRLGAGPVPFVVTVTDADVDPVSLSLSLVDAGSTVPLTLVAEPGVVMAATGGVAIPLQWNAESQRGTGYVTGLQIEVVASDGRGTADPVLSEPFAYGNQAPAVETFSIGVPEQAVQGLVVVNLGVSDAAADLVDVVGFAVAPVADCTGAADLLSDVNLSRAEVFPSGATEDLPTSVSPGLSHTFSWDSTVLGKISSPVACALLTLQDSFGATHSAQTTFVLRNQTPPVLEARYVKSDGDRRTGVIPFTYALYDEESDPVDLLVEYQTNAGAPWYPATEYPVPRSEGVSQLSSAPRRQGGVVHTFFWESGADVFGPCNGCTLRATARDGVGDEQISAPTIVMTASFVAPRDSVSALAPFQTMDLAAAENLAAVLINDFGVGSNFVAALSNQGFAGETGYVQLWSTAIDGFSGMVLFDPVDPSTLLPFGKPAIGMVAADVSLDGLDDMVVLGTQDGTTPEPALFIHVRDFTNIFLGPTVLVSSAVDAAAPTWAARRLLGRRHADSAALVVQFADTTADTVRVLWYAAETAAPTLVGKACDLGMSPNELHDLELADVDDDGTLDLVAAVYDYTVPNYGARAEWFEYSDCGSRGFLAGLHPRDLDVVDLDSDGIDDLLASVAFIDSPLAMAAYSGPLTNAQRRFEVPVAGDPSGAALVRLDGDHVADLLVARNPDWLLHRRRVNNGIAQDTLLNSLTVTASSAQSLISLDTADLNGDSLDDWVALRCLDPISCDTSTISVTYSNPAMTRTPGYFSAATNLAAAEIVSGYIFGDWDGDGVTDLLLSTPQPESRWSLRRGLVDGNVAIAGFAEAEAVSALDGHSMMGRAELTGDGVADILVTRQAGLTWTAWIVPGSADGNGFGAAQPTGIEAPVPSLRTTGDLDGDGISEIIVVTNPATIWKRQPEGQWSIVASLTLGSSTEEVFDVRVVDLNRDGRDDLILTLFLGEYPSDATPDDLGVAVVLNTSTAALSFGTPERFIIGVGPANFAAILASPSMTDFNSDGVLDMLVSAILFDSSNGIPDRTQVWAVRGAALPGAFDVPGFQVTEVDGQSGALPLDVDADGGQDLVLIGETTGVVGARVVGGVPVGTFDLTAVPVEIAAGAVGTTFADLNGDAILDPVGLSGLGEGILLASGRRGGVFDNWRTDATGVGPALSLTPDYFGRTPAAGVARRILLGGADADYQGSTYAGEVSFDVIGDLARADVIRGRRIVPFTSATYLAGDVVLRREPDPLDSGVGTRLRVVPRLGVEDSQGLPRGLDLDPPSGEPRGIRVWLPIPLDNVLSIGFAQPIRMFLRLNDWQRADEVSTDPGAAHPDASAFLPRVPAATGFRDLLVPRTTWIEVPEASGTPPPTGRYFRVLGGTAGLELVTDQLGVVQAFADYGPL